MKKIRFASRNACAARGLALALLAAVLSLGIAGNGPANANESDSAKASFQANYDAALTAMAKAKARYAASQKALRKARQRDRLKGQARIDIYAEIEAAKLELAEAEQVLAAIPEDARRTGVPPGWLREVEERHASES